MSRCSASTTRRARLCGCISADGCRGRFRAKVWATGIVAVGRGQLLDRVPGRTARAPTQWLLGRPRRWLAATEAANNFVKRAAFGFTNFANHRSRALLYAEKPNWALLDT